METRGSENLSEEQAEQASRVAELVFASPALHPAPEPIHSVTEAFKNISVGSPKHETSKVVTPRPSPRGNAGTSLTIPSPHIMEYKTDMQAFQEQLNDPTVEYPLSLCSLFLGDLARNVTEEQIREVFSRFGEVVKVDIKRDKITHNNLGYGFLQYRTPAAACAAKENLNGVEIASRKVRLGWAQKNTTLFVGDLDGTVNTDLLRHIFREYGELVEDETFVKPGVGKFGFVRFKNRADAEKAKASMSRKVIGSRSIRIGWGDNNVQKHCVHVQFDPNDTLTEERLMQAFQEFGPVDSVSLPRHHTGRLKGYCFVHFQDSEEGEKAAAKSISVMSSGVIDDVVVRSSYAKRHGYNKRSRTKPTSGPQQPQMFSSSPVFVASSKPMNFSGGDDSGRYGNPGMMSLANPYFVMPAPGYYPAMQNQGYINQYPKFSAPMTYSPYQTYSRAPMMGRQGQGQTMSYADAGYEQAYDNYSPHLGPAAVMSPVFHPSPMLTPTMPPMAMLPAMAPAFSPNPYSVPPTH